MIKTYVENLDKTGLKQYILSKGYSLSELSEQLGFAPGYLGGILREKERKKHLTISSYKFLCVILKIPEDKFVTQPKPQPASEKTQTDKSATPIQVNAGMTPEQFNALIQAISNLSDNICKSLEKISQAQNSDAIIQGKIYGQMTELTTALGIKPAETNDSKSNVHIKPQYSNAFGGKK